MCPESGTDVGHGGGITRERLETRLDRHFQGGFRATHNPGLKPRAVLYSRSAANSDDLVRTV
jgi:hypothetical protein